MKPIANISRRRRLLSTRKRILFSAVVTFLILGVCYGGSLVWRSSVVYNMVRNGNHGWEGKLHAADAILGHVAVPNAQGAQLLLLSKPVPARFDEFGLRVPVDHPTESRADTSGPKILFLGCSHTYGYGCLAEETYAQQTADALHGRCLNASVSGYGLSQMLVQARERIPQFQPDYVVVQYSSWLVDRSTQLYSPTFFGTLPCPYFAENEDGKLYVHRPVFQSILFELPVNRYHKFSGDTSHALSFLTRVGTPLFVHDDFHVLLSSLKQRCGLIPTPVQDRERIIEFAYGEISKLCRRNHSQMIVVNIQSGVQTTETSVLRQIPDAIFVDAHGTLLELLPEKTDEAYNRAYCHWRGDPPICVDHHPNPEKHRIIAETIVRSLNRVGLR
ncbi:MAG: hypothetical protein IH899_11690 [Planctomycetes bacterium]|nr:hypothetical protein [Planctomycetota bacterium]